MQLIKSVEIAYFRSIYKERISDFKDLNVFFGRNDAGKSNILRGLNLFFNQQTNPNTSFDFDLDFNNRRHLDAVDGGSIRKFIYVTVTFQTPPNYRASLGDEFSVKRQWNVSRGPEFHQEIRGVREGSHQYATRLLNQMRFHYIPAIKDRRIFSSLFQQIYGIIVGKNDFTEALGRFSNDIQSNTDKLFSDLEPVLGFRSALAPPKNLRELFGALDVNTTSGTGLPSMSLILQRGDGLQVRHIPEILKFISDNDEKKFHVWGFEEPENSLELSSAFDEAQRFVEISNDWNKQLFVTSHSPSFFTVTDDKASRFFVSQSDGSSTVKHMVGVDEQLALEMMGDNFFLPIISKSIKASIDEIAKLKEAAGHLKGRLDRISGPLMFVEGKTDKEILELAYKKLYPDADLPFTIVAAGGTTKMAPLAGDGATFKIAGNDRKIFALLDNDFEGRRLGPTNSEGKWQNSRNGVRWWILKPTEQYVSIMTERKMAPGMYSFCIEDCFSDEIRREALSKVAGLNSKYKYSSTNAYAESISHHDLITSSIERAEVKFCVYGPSPEAKNEFVDWLMDRPREDFFYFHSIFEATSAELAH